MKNYGIYCSKFDILIDKNEEFGKINLGGI